MTKNRSVPDVRHPSSEGTAGSRRSFMLALCEFSRERAGISRYHLRRTQGADAKPGESNGTYPTCINDLGAIARPRAAHAGDPWDSVVRRFSSRLLRPFLRLLPGRVRV